MEKPFNSIQVEFIPHKKQRYPTCGDWRIVHGPGDEKVLLISVSAMDDWRSEALVALHEFAEVIMCAANGITQAQVDTFDMEYEKNRMVEDDSEPGDSLDSPYCKQHSLSTAIERTAAAQMAISWPQHEDNINRLFP